jgi:hypothetical protein
MTPDLLGDQREHRLGRMLPRDEGGHPAQRLLLLQAGAQRALQALVLHGEHRGGRLGRASHTASVFLLTRGVNRAPSLLAWVPAQPPGREADMQPLADPDELETAQHGNALDDELGRRDEQWAGPYRTDA